jgi:hypothetical protein
MMKYVLKFKKEDLRALIVIANPESLKEEYDLAQIDVDTTVAKIQAALGIFLAIF